jgi:hypothetical protein
LYGCHLGSSTHTKKQQAKQHISELTGSPGTSAMSPSLLLPRLPAWMYSPGLMRLNADCVNAPASTACSMLAVLTGASLPYRPAQAQQQAQTAGTNSSIVTISLKPLALRTLETAARV